MRAPRAAATLALLLVTTPGEALRAAPAPAAHADVRLRWQLIEDVFAGGDGSARAAFTLTNRGKKPLPASGWALYYNGLHEPREGSVGHGFRAERVTGDLQRLVPGDGFAGLPPGEGVEIEYLTQLLTNNSFAPAGPYLVYDDDPEHGHAIADFQALPFERQPQGDGARPARGDAAGPVRARLGDS